MVRIVLDRYAESNTSLFQPVSTDMCSVCSGTEVSISLRQSWSGSYSGRTEPQAHFEAPLQVYTSEVLSRRCEAETSEPKPLWECGKIHVCKASQGCSRTSLLGLCFFPQTTSIAIQLGQSLWNETQRFPGMLQGWKCARVGNHWKKQPNKGYKNSLY